MKKGTGREMIHSSAPRSIWDDFLERDALIQSHNAHDIYGINIQVLETIVSSKIAEIYPHGFLHGTDGLCTGTRMFLTLTTKWTLVGILVAP